jgi:serpin B
MVRADNPRGIVEGNNKFAFRLFADLKSGNDKNLFCSPFSISTALAMVYAGARNETALQMSQVMNFQQGNQFHAEYKSLLDRLSNGTEGQIRLNIANGLWVQKDFRFLDTYLDIVRSDYGSELKNVDFTNVGEREKTRKEINAWVERKTNDKIKDLLGQNDLEGLTRLVLVNAIYFYSEWANPFEKALTAPQDFFLLDQGRVKTPFMNGHGRYRYYEDSDIKALEIPYRDDKASMVIFLPNKTGGIVEFERSFNYKYYLEIIDSLQFKNVRLSLPKFQTTYKIDLENILSQMGMPLAFSSGGADFSGMTGKRDLCISKVIHQAFINVAEKGTEAAAATAVIMKMTAIGPSPDTKIFIADHPFIFIIKDNTTGSILFMGRIMKPDVSK